MDALLNSDLISNWLPSLLSFIGAVTLLTAANHFIIVRKKHLGSERKVPRQILMLFLTLACIIGVILSLPIEAQLRNQIIGLIGILLSGLIAFSSTNIIGNLMAGILLRITKPFGIGDFVRVGDFFGRVSERGLFDTEIQSESRELISLPNSYLANNPVTTTHPSGAIVSATLSLGYDVHNKKVIPLLIKAAEESGLSDAFVLITELNDFSVSYRVSGFLDEVKGLITARSNLRKHVLDTLHGNGVEIMSPSFMNQRPMPSETNTIPNMHWAKANEERVEAEDIVFDKAEAAQKLSDEKKKLYERIAELDDELKQGSKENQEELKQQLSELKENLAALQGDISEDTGDSTNNKTSEEATENKRSSST